MYVELWVRKEWIEKKKITKKKTKKVVVNR